MGILSVLVVNTHGKTRLSKFYTQVTYKEQNEKVFQTYKLISKRDENSCNFLESEKVWGKGSKIIYRHYATLYFIFVVDGSESELGILDLIRVFVETLDKCFENVCELDLIFHSDKVHHVIDEIITGGLVLETNKDAIFREIETQSKLEKKSKKAPKKVTVIKEKSGKIF